jgi:hypothetical protein
MYLEVFGRQPALSQIRSVGALDGAGAKKARPASECQ